MSWQWLVVEGRNARHCWRVELAYTGNKQAAIQYAESLIPLYVRNVTS